MNSMENAKNKSARSLANSAVNVTLPAFAAERRAAAPCCGARRPPLSIDISCPHGAQQQTCRTPLLRSDGTDGRTDRQTPDRCTDRAPHTVLAMPTNKLVGVRRWR